MQKFEMSILGEDTVWCRSNKQLLAVCWSTSWRGVEVIQRNDASSHTSCTQSKANEVLIQYWSVGPFFVGVVSLFFFLFFGGVINLGFWRKKAGLICCNRLVVRQLIPSVVYPKKGRKKHFSGQGLSDYDRGKV